MKKYVRNVRFILLLICLMISSMLGRPRKVEASSASITLETLTESIQVGDRFSVSVTIKSGSSNQIGEVNAKIKYDTDCLEFSTENSMFEEQDGEIAIVDTGSEANASKKYILQFKAMEQKTARIWVEGTPLIYNSNGNVLSISKNVIQVVAGEKAEKSNNKNLSSLVVKEGELNHKFNKRETSYKVTVPQEVKAVTIVAVPEDSKSKVTITGADKLLVGENAVVITVTSETKRTKDYNITVTRGGETGIFPSPTADATTDGVKTEEDKDQVLPSQRPEVEEKEERMSLLEDYQFLSVTNLRTLPAGYLSVALTIEDANVDAYQSEHQKDQDLYLVYAKYKGQDPSYYKYDKKEGTIQRYVSEDQSSDTLEEMISIKDYNKRVQKLGLIIGICAGIITMLVLVLLRQSIKKYKEDRKGFK